MKLTPEKINEVSVILMSAEIRIKALGANVQLLPLMNKVVEPEDIRLLICESLNITVRDFIGKCQKRKLSDARMIFYLVSKSFFEKFSDRKIASLTGRDRTGINRALKVGNGLLKNNYLFRAKWSSVIGKINMRYPLIQIKLNGEN